MRARLLLALLLFALFAGCTGKLQEKAEQHAKPEVEQPATGFAEEDAEIDALLQEVQSLEEFLSDMESIDTLELSL